MFGELARKLGIYATHDTSLVVAQVPDGVVNFARSVNARHSLRGLPFFNHRVVDITSKKHPDENHLTIDSRRQNVEVPEA